MARHLLLLGALFLLILIGGCGARVSPVSEYIASRVALGPGTLVDIDSVADFDWDRFFVFEPYTPIDAVEAELGFEWPSGRGTKSANYDGWVLVVFVADSRVVHSFDHPRDNGDLVGLVVPGGYTPGEAQFIVSVAGDPNWLILEPVGKQRGLTSSWF
jgi:hypothetical protein